VEVRDVTTAASRFFAIASKLPIELQMILCNRLYGLGKELISSRDSEEAFKTMTRRLER